MDAIVCADAQWGIGRENRLLFRISEDLRRFRRLTLGKTLLMGRNTFLSLPNGKPLPDRKHIVLSTTLPPQDGVLCVSTLAEALQEAGEEAFVIGGAQVYAALLPYCAHAYVTRVQERREADCFFPDLDASPDWRLAVQGEWREEAGLRFRYTDYEALHPLPIPREDAL